MGDRVRPAEERDQQALLALSRRFHEASGSSEIAPMDDESMGAMLGYLRTSPDGMLLVAEKEGLVVGMVGALVHPVYYNVHHRAAYEVFWWVNPEARGIGSKLFRRLKEEAKARGATTLTASLLERMTPEKVGAFYEREGLHPLERSYVGRL